MTNPTSLTLRKQMLEDRLKTVASLLDISEDQAFMRLAYALIFNTSYDDPTYDQDVVDGGDDKQIDIVKIEEVAEQATIHILQIKNTEKYKGTTVVQIRDGLEWAFKWPEEKYKNITNKDLVIKINAIRELSGRLGLRKLDVVVHYVAKGDSNKLSPDFENEVQHTVEIYEGSGEFRSFEFKIWDVNKLIDKSYEIEEESIRIDVDIPIYFTPYAPSYSQYRAGAIKAVVCTVSGVDLAELVNKYHTRIFEENVRTFLGSRKKVNAEILQTCSDDNDAEYFWFFNNGITVTCRDFDVAYNVENPCIKIFNMQIVNGCQTSMTLADAQKNGILSEKTRVMLKVYASQDETFIDKITLTTNHQNAVTNRDLRSNDITQRDLEKLFKERGYYYERKVRMFSKLSKKEQKQRIIPNDKLGQAHLAIVQHLPAIAMAQPSKIWEEYYNDIYKSRIEELLASYLIFNYCTQKRSPKNLKALGLSGMEESIIKYGTFHLARIVGSYQLGEFWRKAPSDKLESFIHSVENTPEMLDESHEKAKETLKKVVEDIVGDDFSRMFNIFKSGDIQKRLDTALNSS